MSPFISGQEAMANDNPIGQDGITTARSMEENLYWSIILLIPFWMVWGFFLLIIIKFKRKPEERKRFSISPMKGPSTYQKEKIMEMLASLDNRCIHRSDLEARLEKDLEIWEHDWDLDPNL